MRNTTPNGHLDNNGNFFNPTGTRNCVGEIVSLYRAELAFGYVPGYAPVALMPVIAHYARLRDGDLGADVAALEKEIDTLVECKYNANLSCW